MDATYKNTLEIARAEFEQLITEESELQLRLEGNRNRQAGLKKTIDSLSALIGEDSDAGIPGISDAIRTVLSNHYETDKRTILMPTGIRNRLASGGFDLGNYKNPMAVIHTTLKRLEEQGEVEALEAKDKKIGYRWVPKPDGLGGITDDDVPF
jgi:hypothetical protein